MYTYAEIRRKQNKAKYRFISGNVFNLKDLVICLLSNFSVQNVSLPVFKSGFISVETRKDRKSAIEFDRDVGPDTLQFRGKQVAL